MATLTEVDYDPFSAPTPTTKGTPSNWQTINAASASMQPQRDSDRLKTLQAEYAQEADPTNQAALQREIKRMGATPTAPQKQTQPQPSNEAKLTEVDYDPFAKSQKPAAPKTSMLDDIKQGAGNLVAGAVRGAGSIGATLLAPIDIAKDAIDGKGLSLESNRQRRSDMDSALQTMGAEPNSWMYKGGALGGEMAGTAGIGNLLAGGIRAAPIIAKYAPEFAPKLANAISTGGFKTGAPAATSFTGKAADLGIRSAGAAITGAAGAGLVNPEDATTGAVIGAALPSAGKALVVGGKALGNGAANLLGAIGTHTGGDTIKKAAAAGYEGGERAKSFLANISGDAPQEKVLDDAKLALSKMYEDRSKAYRSGMTNIKGDKTVLDFSPVEKSVNNVLSTGTYKGQVINKSAADTQQKIAETINQWKGLSPAEYHTPEGMDALKKAIGDIRDSTEFRTPARLVADNVYNAVKKQITDQAPKYAEVMKDYENASGLVKEIERTFSLGEKASADIAIRKLQSLSRNNASTNYGSRLRLADELEKYAPNLTSDIAGQALSSWTPRGLGGLVAGGTAIGGIAASNPLTALALAAQSPKIVGRAAFELGRGAGAVSRGVNSLVNRIPQAEVGGMRLSRQSEYPINSLSKISAPPQTRNLLSLADDVQIQPQQPKIDGIDFPLEGRMRPLYERGGIKKQGGLGIAPDRNYLAMKEFEPAQMPVRSTLELADLSKDEPVKNLLSKIDNGNSIDFPLRQEVLQQPEISKAIDTFKSQAEDLRKVVKNAISPKVRENAQNKLAALEDEFASGMKQLGIDSAQDAHGLNRPLYESGKTKLPVKKTHSPKIEIRKNSYNGKKYLFIDESQ